MWKIINPLFPMKLVCSCIFCCWITDDHTRKSPHLNVEIPNIQFMLRLRHLRLHSEHSELQKLWTKRATRCASFHLILQHHNVEGWNEPYTSVYSIWIWGWSFIPFFTDVFPGCSTSVVEDFGHQQSDFWETETTLNTSYLDRFWDKYGDILSPQIAWQPSTPIPSSFLAVVTRFMRNARCLQCLNSDPKNDASWVHVPMRSKIHPKNPACKAPYAQPWDPQNHAVAAKKAFDLVPAKGWF